MGSGYDNFVFSACDALEEICVNENNQNYMDRKGILFTKDGTVLMKCPSAVQGDYVIPDGVCIIQYSAFEGCCKLTTITCSDTVTSIGDFAFESCKSLNTVIISGGVERIPERAFEYCDALTRIEVSDKNSNITDIDGVVFSKDGTSLLLYPRGRQGSYEIPSAVTCIGMGAFRGCDAMTDVAIPNSVVKIEERAFYDSNGLNDIIIPYNVSDIGDAAFTHCNKLMNIAVSEENQFFRDLDGVLFTKDGKEILFYPQGRNGKYVIPDGVNIIDSESFNGCSSLTDIVIPSSVETIENEAFYSCYNLTNVF